MRKLFYARLAVTNLQKNRRTYVPYLFTCIGVVLLFYNACALSFHPSMHGSTQQMMYIGTIVTAIFSAVFLFYTHSFLLKRRKKELGLFHLLGMEKRHIARIMLWETLLVSGCSMAGGLLLGVIFSKLITLLLYKLLRFDPDFAFEISGRALWITAVLFAAIFLLILLNSLAQVRSTQTIDLLKGSNVGEREPKTKRLLAALGLLALGTGYAVALLATDPLAALPAFLLAVLLVIAGTYCLFTAGSIALLKALRRNQRFYYQARHFVSVSGMMYRMKQNAAGLANICLMSTAVLVMISTTVAMYVGLEDLLDNRYPKDFSLEVEYTPEQRPDTGAIAEEIGAILSESGQTVTEYSAYQYLSFAASRDGSAYSLREENYIVSSQDMSMLVVMTAEEYQGLAGQALELGAGEAAVYTARRPDAITLLDRTYPVRYHLDAAPPVGELAAWLVDVTYVVLPGQEEVDAVYAAQHAAFGKEASPYRYQVSFNLEMDEDAKESYTADLLLPGIKSRLPEAAFQVSSKQLSRSKFFELYGGLFFLGLFLGTLFLMATVLIIYYKQVVEGFEDQQRFRIMQQVGMSTEEVKRSIRSQVLTVFALPILAALVHISVAFPILTRLLALLNLTNIPLFAGCMAATALVFILAYGLVYLLTARVYYKIVRQ